VNEYKANQLKANRIKLFYSANQLWLLEDKYPNVQNIQPEVLWTTEVEASSNGAPYRLIVTNDGYVSLRDSDHNVLWVCPQIPDTTSTTPSINVTQDALIQTDPEDTSRSYIGLWIMLVICLCCPCLIWLFYPEYRQRRKHQEDVSMQTISKGIAKRM